MDDRVLYSLVELGTVAVEVVLIVLYCNRLHLTAKVSVSMRTLCFAVFFLPLALMSLFPVLSALRVLYSFVGLAVLYRFCYDADWPNSVYMTAVFLLLAVIADILCSACLGWMGISENGLADTPFHRIAYNGMSKLIHLILIQAAPLLIRRKEPHLSLAGAAPLLTAQFASLAICLCLYFSGTGEASLETVIGVLATLYVNIVICFYVEAISAKNEMAREKEVAEREYQYNLKYYASVKQSQEENPRFVA